jgi:LacI family transcriptional regulator
MPRKSGRTTVYSLGAEPGVSAATISKALRGSPEISVELSSIDANSGGEEFFTPLLNAAGVIAGCRSSHG